MVGSDIGDINCPANVGSRPSRVDPKLFGKPSDFSGDRREWRHFEWAFRNWFGFLYDTAEECLDQAESALGELGEAVPDRRGVVHESGHGVQERASGRYENDDSQAWLRELAQTEQGVRSDDFDVVARVHESSGIRLWNHGWIQEEIVQVGKSDC